MKTNTVRRLGLMVAAALMAVCFASCEVEVHDFYDDDNIPGSYSVRSSQLCSHTWRSYYWSVEGNRCRQDWDFFSDRTGIDYVRVEYPDGYVEEYRYTFTWHWDNYEQTSIRMVYAANDVSFLDDVYLGGNRLGGYLDGRDNYVEFQGL